MPKNQLRDIVFSLGLGNNSWSGCPCQESCWSGAHRK